MMIRRWARRCMRRSVPVDPTQSGVDVLQGLLGVLLTEEHLADLRPDDVLRLALVDAELARLQFLRAGEHVLDAGEPWWRRHLPDRGQLADLVGPLGLEL